MKIKSVFQKLLFERVGFTPKVLMMLCQRIENTTINDRTARRWAAGEVIPKNPAYVSLAIELDSFLTDKALYILEQVQDKLIVPYYADDEAYYEATGELMPVSVYHALLQRLIVMAQDDIVIDYRNDDNMTDWDNYVSLDVGFNLFF